MAKKTRLGGGQSQIFQGGRKELIPVGLLVVGVVCFGLGDSGQQTKNCYEHNIYNHFSSPVSLMYVVHSNDKLDILKM